MFQRLQAQFTPPTVFLQLFREMHSIHRNERCFLPAHSAIAQKKKAQKTLFHARLQLKFIAMVVENILLFFSAGYAIS